MYEKSPDSEQLGWLILILNNQVRLQVLVRKEYSSKFATCSPRKVGSKLPTRDVEHGGVDALQGQKSIQSNIPYIIQRQFVFLKLIMLSRKCFLPIDRFPNQRIICMLFRYRQGRSYLQLFFKVIKLLNQLAVLPFPPFLYLLLNPSPSLLSHSPSFFFSYFRVSKLPFYEIRQLLHSNPAIHTPKQTSGWLH